MFDLYLKCLIGSDNLTSFITLFVCKDTTFSETGKDLDEKSGFHKACERKHHHSRWGMMVSMWVML